ncbi:MAG: histidine phosphatase family protein [Phycisphaerales bacterium]
MSAVKTLIILRHGKAAPHDAYPTDHERPLVVRGHAEAEFIGRHLHDHGPRPELVVSSPVLRAFTTAQLVAKHLRCPLETDQRLMTDVAASTAWAAAEDALKSRACVLVAGHNPTLSSLLEQVIKASGTGHGDMHTGEAAIVQFDGEPALRSGKLIDRVRLSAE